MIILQTASNLEYDSECIYLTTVLIVFWDVIHYSYALGFVTRRHRITSNICDSISCDILLEIVRRH